VRLTHGWTVLSGQWKMKDEVMSYKSIRQTIKLHTSNSQTNILILNGIGIDISKDGFCKVRPDEKTASCKINNGGSFHDFGSGEHYSDIVSLLFDGYQAFDTLPETMQWLCEELNIPWEISDE